MEASKSIFSRNRVEPVAPPVVFRDGSLRQRGGAAAPVEIEESLLQPDQDAPVRGDSMSLFATLVPPPLRKSKKNFTSGEWLGRSFLARLVCKRSTRTLYACFRIDKSQCDANPSPRCLLPPPYCILKCSCGVRCGSVKSCTSHPVSAEGVGRREGTASGGASMNSSANGVF